MELTKRLTTKNDLGLHGRAAAKIVKTAGRYKSKLYFKRDGHEEVDGSSILSILTLACSKGTILEIRAVGEDSAELLDEITRLFDQKFDEE